jgi:hypothetical protein
MSSGYPSKRKTGAPKSNPLFKCRTEVRMPRRGLPKRSGFPCGGLTKVARNIRFCSAQIAFGQFICRQITQCENPPLTFGEDFEIARVVGGEASRMFISNDGSPHSSLRNLLGNPSHRQRPPRPARLLQKEVKLSKGASRLHAVHLQHCIVPIARKQRITKGPFHPNAPILPRPILHRNRAGNPNIRVVNHR